MEPSPEGGDGDENPAAPATRTGKSCKGCLLYSSMLKSDGRNPICLGISQSLKQVPSYIVGESEMEAAKDGRNLTDFKYACVGYSVFLNGKDKSSGKLDNPVELPLCAGLELLLDRRPASVDHSLTHVHNKEENTRTTPRSHKPVHNVGEEFFSRFTRNAGLVASGVGRNLRRVGSYIKENLDDIFFPYRRRPK